MAKKKKKKKEKPTMAEGRDTTDSNTRGTKARNSKKPANRKEKAQSAPPSKPKKTSKRLGGPPPGQGRKSKGCKGDRVPPLCRAKERRAARLAAEEARLKAAAEMMNISSSSEYDGEGSEGQPGRMNARSQADANEEEDREVARRARRIQFVERNAAAAEANAAAEAERMLLDAARLEELEAKQASGKRLSNKERRALAELKLRANPGSSAGPPPQRGRRDSVDDVDAPKRPHGDGRDIFVQRFSLSARERTLFETRSSA